LVWRIANCSPARCVVVVVGKFGGGIGVGGRGRWCGDGGGWVVEVLIGRRDGGVWVWQTSKLKKGQELKGTVKNIIRNGAFIEFAEEGEEGFLRGSEITEGGENVAVDSLLTVGQEVTVRVLKIERGKAALTMKPQVDVTSINDSINPNVGAGGASNPFATFFRSANLVPEAPASVDAQEATPAAEEVSAVQEAPAVEEAVSVEETAAAQESAAVEETPAVEEKPAVEETAAVAEAPAVEETAAAGEIPGVGDATPGAEVVFAVQEGHAVEEAATVEEIAAVQESAAAEEIPAVDERPDVEETPAVEETAAVAEPPAVEETAVVDETPGLEDRPAVEETPSTEAAQTEAPDAEESGGESSQAEEPRALSLGEIAEGIGSAVQEIEKVAEAAGGTVRGHLPS
jgi:predicted RNA-binding protein with RPS1 domain